MKRWEQEQKTKKHQKRVQSARPAVNSNLKTLNKFQRSPSFFDASLFPLLKQHSLQQYYRKLRELGYEDSLVDLLNLSPRELDELLLQIKTLPGHQSKFKEMLSTLESLFSQDSTRAASISVPITTNRFVSLGESPLFQSKYSFSPKTTHDIHIPHSDTKREEAKKLQEELEEAISLIANLEFEIRKTQPPIQLNKKMPVDISRDSFFQAAPSFEECKNPAKLDTQEVGKSIDSMKMRSTLINLDIEEICRCYSRVLHNHVEQNLPVINNNMLPSTMRHRLLEIFNDEPEQADESTIYNFAKNLVARAQLENEIPIVSLVYLDRFVAKTGVRITENNWKRIMFISFVEASKVWDDESFENNSFAIAITKYTIQEINQMEERFLALLDFEMKISGADYAKAYFMLRTYAHEKDRSFPLKALEVEKVLSLQKKASVVEQDAKARYEPLLKTL